MDKNYYLELLQKQFDAAIYADPSYPLPLTSPRVSSSFTALGDAADPLDFPIQRRGGFALSADLTDFYVVTIYHHYELEVVRLSHSVEVTNLFLLMSMIQPARDCIGVDSLFPSLEPLSSYLITGRPAISFVPN